MKKIAFIVPFFGKLPNYFQLWLFSCAHNESIDWFLFTDDRSSFNYPFNVKVKYCEFEFVINKFKLVFGPDISLKNPYQLCEFKVSYGIVFQEYLNDYDFWGYCDVDVIWGNLRNFFTDSVLLTYEKIGWRGHLTLFRNKDKINKIFMDSIKGINWWEIAVKNKYAFPLALDEGGVNYLFERNKLATFSNFPFADLKIRSFSFQCMHSVDLMENSGLVPQIFLWRNGLYRISIRDDRMEIHEFTYIHFLKRPMDFSADFSFRKFYDSQSFWIVPNKFLNEDEIDFSMSTIGLFADDKFYVRYFCDKISFKYLKGKFKYLFSKYRFKNEFGEFNFDSPCYTIDLSQVNSDFHKIKN